MDHEEQVGKNFAWGFFSQLITRLFGFVFFVFMSHILLERGMGQYNFVVAFVAFWFILSDFGVSNFLYREWSKGEIAIAKIKDDFNVAFTLKSIVSLLIFIPFILVSWYVNNEIFLASLLYYTFVYFSSIISLIETYFNSVNNFKMSALRGLLEKGVIILVGGIALYLTHSVNAVFAAMVLSQIVALVYYFTGRFPFIPSFSVDWPRIKKLIIRGLPFALFGVIVTVYGRIDMVMLRYMQDFETVGWYSAAYKAYEVANIFPGILFLPAIFPVLSRIYNEESRAKYTEFFNRSLRILFSTSLLLTMFFIFVAPLLIQTFFPESFAASILAMRIIVLVLTVSSFSVLFTNLIVIQNKEKLSIKIIIASAIANILLNIYLIPKYSLYGAASATVIAEVFNLYLLQHFVDWDKDKPMLFKMGFVFVLSAITFSVIKYTGYMNNLFVGAIVTSITIWIFWILGLIQKGDLEMFYLPVKNKLKLMFFNQDEL